MKQLLIHSFYHEIIKGESFTIIVRDFNFPLPVMDRTARQKINKEMEGLNHTINQLGLIDTYRTLYPTTTDYRMEPR